MENITPEMLKADLEETATIFQDLLRDMREKVEIPENWNNGLIINITKREIRQDTM